MRLIDRPVNRGILSTTLLALAATLPLWAERGEAVTVSFSMPDPNPSLGEPVFVEFSIHNGLPEVVRADLGPDRKGNFRFTIIGPGQAPGGASRPERGGVKFFGILSLAPDERYTQELLLNEWYEFLEPGKYVVQVQLIDSIRTQSGNPVSARLSANLPVAVRARDPERLNTVCRELAEKAALPYPDIAREAARALSHVNDPLAVPHLGQVLRDSVYGRLLAIEGLARIRNAEAVDVLQSSLDGADQEVRPHIRGALNAIQAGRPLPTPKD